MTAHENMCVDSLSMLCERAGLLDIELDERQQQQLVAYCELLLETNERMNLTAVRTPEGVMGTLILDSLTVALALPRQFKDSSRVLVIDVGSGAGFPGIPLKIVFPGWRLILVESVHKKARFLAHLAERLGLENVSILDRRAEEIGLDRQWRDSADLCLARAVSPLASLVELCAPLVKPRGLLVFPKGPQFEMEIEGARAAADRLRAQIRNVVGIPEQFGLRQGRVLVVYAKLGETPSGYPRRIGLAQSRPIGS